MRIKRIRFRKEYRLKGRLFIFITVLCLLIFVPRSNRAFLQSYFSTRCRSNQQVYSKKLNDRVIDYSSQARTTGIEACTDFRALNSKVISGQLSVVKSSRLYKVEDLTHSYPYLTRNSKRLLREIAKRFRNKIEKEGLKGSKFIITSMTRTTEKIKGLGKTNINVSENSPHLHGNAFDISYAHFSFMKYKVTECDKWYMKEALAEIIWELKKENKCWATYERQQGCFHVVSRK